MAMKYLTTAHEYLPSIVIGYEVSHTQLAKAALWRPVSAGEFEIKDGLVRTFGRSYGLNLAPKERDAGLLAAHLGLGEDKVHPDREYGDSETN